MNRIEIKQRKKIVVPFLLVGALILAIGGYVVLFTENYSEDNTKVISYWGGVLLFALFMFSPIKKLLRNESIVVMTEDAIILNQENNVLIPKAQIEQIEVEYVDGSGYFLNISSSGKRYATNISWLDKTPEDIKELIKKYK